MKNILLYLLLTCCAEGYAQQNTQEEDSVLNLLPQASAPYSDVEIPRIIPPSPETFSIFRFVDYPVNHSTGVPEISIPLYNITCGSLNVPIAIDYHAGGRQISDLSGPIGLGWILNAGGIISRTIYGFPDEEQPVPSNLKKSTEISIKK